LVKDVKRPSLLAEIERGLRRNPVVLLLGPRQCGKTTLARIVAQDQGAEYFDLERPDDARRMAEPMLALEGLKGLVVIDEAQLQPALFPVLRVLADRKPLPARFLLLGSAAPDLFGVAGESLAGRVARIEMSGFCLAEAGATRWRELWWRGGLPRSFLAEDDADSVRWREDFIATFLERDLRRLGVEVAPSALRRFWHMVAHYHGQIWNASEIGRSLGLAHTTVRRHLDILTGALVMRELPPWFENLGKRQVKSPKVYLRDSGLLHTLLGVNSAAGLEVNPRLGASWEGFALEETLRAAGSREAYFWSTQAGAELDLLLFHRGRRIGLEFKYADAPTLTRSMHVARNDLRLEHLLIVHPGTKSYPVADWAETVALRDLPARFRAQD
jgi:predicted AAA+ superfamily ATPase